MDPQPDKRELDPAAIEAIRKETPGLSGGGIFLNSAGSSLPPRRVLEAQLRHLQREAEVGGYRAAEEAKESLDDVRLAVAELLHADPDEVALLGSATEAWRMAFYGHVFKPGDVILTDRAAYGSNAIALLQVCRRTGAVMEVAPDDEYGQVSLDWLEERLGRGDVKMMALTHIPTGEGLINPAQAVGRLTRRFGVPYLLDACQSVGQRAIDVESIGCDMLSATGRKFLRGPRGTGLLFVRRDYQDRFEPPMLDNQSAEWVADDSYVLAKDATRYEQFEGAMAARLGLGAACRYALELGLPAIQSRIEMLAALLREGLSEIPGLRVHDRGMEHGGIVTFTVEGLEPREVMARLREQGIETVVSPLESYRLGLGPRGLSAVSRASVHVFNTEDEMGRVVEAVRRLVG